MNKTSRIVRQLLETEEPFVSQIKRQLYSDGPTIGWAEVTWRADVEYRSWGIKGIDVFVDRVVVTVEEDEETGQEGGEHTLSAETGWTLQAVMKSQEERALTLYPVSLDVDWRSKVAYVEF
jgi:hypothetical protein